MLVYLFINSLLLSCSSCLLTLKPYSQCRELYEKKFSHYIKSQTLISVVINCLEYLVIAQIWSLNFLHHWCVKVGKLAVKSMAFTMTTYSRKVFQEARDSWLHVIQIMPLFSKTYRWFWDSRFIFLSSVVRIIWKRMCGLAFCYAFS